jgi:serine/threonine protein kinase
MALAAGTLLGPHRLVSLIGAGGMGEVYKATDTRLNRTVAIKVLSPHFSENPELKQRFAQEAQTIASLKHPHICVLYDVGNQDGVDYLVMEYLEGESLAERLSRGPLPLDQALKLAREISDALDKAHRQGVVHRDCKPGNIMMTKAGAKLLDFGLARLKQPGPAPAFAALSSLPTERSGLTATGTILGTLQYMAPEQLEGKEADSRTDIFAFGAVLYETVTGKKAFEGKSQVSLIGAILEREPPPIATLQPASPPALDLVIKRCLAKDPDERWQSAGDLAVGLNWLTDPAIASGGQTLSKPARRSRLWPSVAGVSSLIAIALAAMLVYDYLAPRESAAVRFFISAPDKTVFESGVAPGNNGYTGGSISPDARKLAFTARDEAGKVMLWVRAMDTLAAETLPGTDGAAMPFWSPDSRSIAFFAQGKLKKIDVEGGPPLTLSDAPNPRGMGSWNQDSVIVFGPANDGPLSRVSSSGGQPVAVTQLSSGVTGHRFPSFLPDGRHFFYFANGPSAESTGVFIGSLDSLESRRLLAADSPAVFAQPGYALFIRQGTLLAQPFDAEKLQLNGEAVPIAEQVAFHLNPAHSTVEKEADEAINSMFRPIL